MAWRFGLSSKLVLMFGLFGGLIWNIYGKGCSGDGECRPDVTCRIVPWSCNYSQAEPTAAPTPDPLNPRCCEHLGTCGKDTEVAGWVNVRNTSIMLDNVPYTAEWLDTFVTEGNGTNPVIIKSAYAGSWSTLKQDGMKFPAQIFVAEPTNSCTTDGEPKWPEWYQVTVNVIANEGLDSTLAVEADRSKDCLCDVQWQCKNNLCWVETKNVSEGGSLLSKTNTSLEENVAEFCRTPHLVNVTNHTASSSFSLGFGPKEGALDDFNFNTSVEGGWAPSLDDIDMWFQVNLDEDTIISGITLQGVAVNSERRVDEFKVEYEASDSGSPTTVGPDTVFKAGARLDTKMTNNFVTPIKANRIKLLIKKPCDPFYVGLRIQLLGCPVCSSDADCTMYPNGKCLIESFCIEEVTTTTLTTTTLTSTTLPSTILPTTTLPITTDKTTIEVTPETTATPQSVDGSTTIDTPASTSSTPTPPTVPTTQTATEMATVQTSDSPIQNKIYQTTRDLDPKVRNSVETLLLDLSKTVVTTIPKKDITRDVIRAGLDVIENVTTVANTTRDIKLQKEILLGAWNFLAAIVESNEFTNGSKNIDEDLVNEYLTVSSLVLDEDRGEAWKEIQQESAAGPIRIVVAVEELTVTISKNVKTEINITINKENIAGIILGQPKRDFLMEDYSVGFELTGIPEDSLTYVKITKEDFASNDEVKNLNANDSLVVIVLKFSSIEEILDNNDTQDNTPIDSYWKKRLGSDVISVSVVGKHGYSVPLTFRLGHKLKTKSEDPRCSFWKSSDNDNKVSGEWLTDGCVTSNKDNKSTTCSCNHMTNYAILMWLGPGPPPEDTILDTISLVGCLISICALALALALLFFLKSSLSSERIIIHIHLMCVTLIAMVLFVAGVNKTENKTVCQLITIALHFFYMSMFSWMLVEGIHLYRQIIAVFESEKSRLWVYFAIGWGIPVIVVGVTTGIFLDDYRNHKACWLEHEDNSLWAFLGPMIPTIVVNFVVLVMVSRIVMTAAKLHQERPAFNSAKAGLRSSLLLLPILGVTWVFGYFVTLDKSFQYTFVILNSLQGFFMALFHCFMSSEVNGALKQKIKRLQDSSLGGASSGDSGHKTTLTSGIRKIKVAPSQTDNTDGF